MEKGYITFSKTKIEESRFLKVLPVSINNARDIIYQDLSQNGNYKFLGYECVDLKKLFGFSNAYVKADTEWLKAKESDDFLPDKLLALYNYAREVFKKGHDLSISIYSNDQDIDIYNSKIKLLKFPFWEKFKVSDFLTNEDGTEQLTDFDSLKGAFTFITNLIKQNQDTFSKFKVKANENWFYENFNFKYFHKTGSVDTYFTKYKYADREEEERSAIKEAASDIKDFFMNAYYFQYEHQRIHERYNGSCDKRTMICEERVLAKTKEEAESIFYKMYPTGGRINCAAWETKRPLSYANKEKIEELKMEIDKCKKQIKQLSKETPVDLARVEECF